MQIFVHDLGFSKRRAEEILTRILLKFSQSVEKVGDSIVCEKPEIFVCFEEKGSEFSIPRTEVRIICSEDVHEKIAEAIMLSAAGG